jgi:hypothetical protein
MGLLGKIWGYLKGVGRAITARYESAYQRWGERSWLGQSYQSARLDADASTRQELLRRHRYWVANSSLVNRIRNLFIQFSVGVNGLEVVPNSDDEDWNILRKTQWDNWGRQPDLSSRSQLGWLCVQWAGSLFDDGEVFILKAQGPGGRPMLQTIEAHRVSTPKDRKDQEGKRIIDGVQIDSNGKPIGYWIQDEFAAQSNIAGNESNRLSIPHRYITADNVIHIFKARRPGMYRGIPEGFAGMNTLHDYEDLHLMEMQVAKMAAAIGNIETNPTGELDTTATRRMRLTITSQNQASQAVNKNADQYYKVILGAQTIALKHGDSLKQFQVDRPNICQQQYWDLLISEICCAYNVPKLLVVPYSLQGTVTRADLDICTNAFRVNFELIAQALEEVYEWQLAWDVRYNRAMDGKPPQNFTLCNIQPPRAPNVDIGYNAQALQLELTMGTKTIQDVYAERQQDWRHQLTQIAESRAFIHKLATKFGITPDEISQIASSSSPEPGDEEKPEPKEAETVKTL